MCGDVSCVVSCRVWCRVVCRVSCVVCRVSCVVCCVLCVVCCVLRFAFCVLRGVVCVLGGWCAWLVYVYVFVYTSLSSPSHNPVVTMFCFLLFLTLEKRWASLVPCNVCQVPVGRWAEAAPPKTQVSTAQP